jgi:predicted O-linked N-acetylglucosamine transferase (SPINDLY family)
MHQRPSEQRQKQDGEAVLQRAMAALDRGDLATATAEAQLAIDMSPGDGLAWEILSLALYRGGALEPALTAGHRAVGLKPEAADFHANLGVVLRAAGHLEEAEAAYRAAIAVDPAFAPAHNNLGNMAREKGAFSEAERNYRSAIAINPAYAEAWHGLGIALQRQDKLADAEEALQTAVSLRPARADIMSDLAATAMAMQKFDDAVALLEKAIATDPNCALAYGNLGALKLRLNHFVAAEQATARAMALAPGEQRWVSNLGVINKDLSRYGSAEALFRRALSLKPDYALAHANLLFCLNYHPDLSAEEIFAEYERFDAAHARRHRPEKLVYANDPTPSRRLRVGFLSPDFREHAARHFLDPLLRHLDRTRLEVVCYAEVTNPDAVTESFKAMADAWRSTVGLSDEALADRIRADRIDILVDFGGHTSASRILVMARKPAPIQVAHHLGHGYTSGLSAIDVFLSDQEMAPPGSEHLFAEKTIVRLPRIPVAYQPPAGMPEVGPLPATHNGFVTFGYFGRPERINDRVVAAWAAILKRVANSRLILNSKAFSEAAFCDLTAGRFAAHGVGRDRLMMVYTAPQPKTWSAYGEVDIALDPFPHNAGTTTIEALWLGVPVVSVEDRPSVGRFGASNLAAVGLRDWVAKDVEGYVALAATKASDVAALAALRSGLRARVEASPLADGPGLARDLEAAFRQIWNTWCEGHREQDAAAVRAAFAHAIAAYQAGDYVRAIALSNAVIAAEPHDTEAYHLRGVAAYKLGRLSEAVADLSEAIRREPERADFRWNMTPMLRLMGRLGEAEVQGREAVRLAPNSSEAHNNLATVYKDLGRAAEAEAHLRHALTLKPEYSDAWSNLSWTLSLAGNAREAETAARQALLLKPNDANARNNLGTALMQQDRLPEAGECFAAALALKPDFTIAHSNYLFCLNYRTDLSPEAIFEAYVAWDRAHALPLMPARPEWQGSRDPDRPLRIGYVSPDLRYHAVSFFIESLIAAHDQTRYEVTCYAEVANPDAVTERFRRHATRWRSTVGLSDAEVADLIRRDGIDVLIDLAGHTSGNRLLAFARRPAPVQLAHMVGAGTTTGLSAIDAFLINDALCPPGAERFFSERPIRLSRMPHVYVPPDGMPEVGSLPALRNGFVTFGCFSRPARINEDVIRSWTRILKSVPHSRLVLNSKPFREEENCIAWHARFADLGLEPGRVKLVYTSPQPKTWDAYGTIDIALDPFPHNAGTTTIEALWLGVPVVSLASRPPVGRFGASILGSVGLDDWVTHDVDGYVARAVTAASNIQALSRLRASLRDKFKASPIGHDAEGLAREVEDAYRALWRGYCARGVRDEG